MEKAKTSSLTSTDVTKLLRQFSENASRSAEASADGLVSVRVNARLAVISVEFLDPKLDAETKERLQAATVSAVNAAMRKVALTAGQALIALESQKKA